MNKTQNRRLSEADLVKIANVDITTIRRYFKSTYNAGLMAYHRRLRLNYAKNLIKNGNNIQNASKIAGFRSVNGFIYAYSKEFGNSPRDIKTIN
ncbi:MAG: helix-turn-helix domain-containing protein [Candidatus Hodarchaeales archaeon]|jgi:AraC-like DNA-binding protein